MIYPGDTWCNPSQYAHAKWHHESAVGLLDLIYTCDNVFRLTSELMSTSTQTATASTSLENPTTTAGATHSKMHIQSEIMTVLLICWIFSAFVKMY